jgi:Chlorophyll A-B binding protein
LTESDPLQQQPVLVSSELSAVALAASTKIFNSYAINGWVPKDDYALWGLPGSIAPLGFFDPLGFARQGLPLNDAKRLREAEVQHGRVAMLAVVGYLSQEFMNTLGGGPFHITGPANDQLQQVPTVPFAVLTLMIGAAEIYRAKKGWVEPIFRIGSKTLFTLREDYYPGDLGFDPLGLKPTENYEFQRMQTKELSNGRLAMLAWAGMCAQELVNHRTIGETWSFYSTLFSGGDLSPFYN